MHIVADEGISHQTVLWLRSQGHQVLSIQEERLFGAEDTIVLALALAEQAVLLTRDVHDFSRITSLAGKPHYGIVNLRPGRNETNANIIALLERFLARYGNKDLTGRIVTINPKKVRFRPPLEEWES